jgi:hypothetical protein
MPVKTILLSLAVIVMAGMMVTASGCKVVTGSGETITLEMDYEDFERIEVSYAFDVDIERADTYKVHIIIDETLLEYLHVDKSGGTIYIGLKSGNTNMDQTRKAEITLPRLQRLELSGASDGIVRGFSGSDDMDFELSGASSLEVVDLKAGNIDVDISGASEFNGNIEIREGEFDLSGASILELTGSASDTSLEASGASDVRLAEFTTVNANIELSGASDAEIIVNQRLEIDLSGASELIYHGNPKVGSINVSGGSTIMQK